MINLTAIGIFISAIGGMITIYEKIFSKNDKYIVRYGTYKPCMEDRAAMFVVNKSRHAIYLRDFGFILDDGTLDSIVWTAECACDDDNYDIEVRGSCDNIKFNQHVEFFCRTTKNTVGAFAISSAREFPKLGFAGNICLLRRLHIRIKILWHYLFN